MELILKCMDVLDAFQLDNLSSDYSSLCIFNVHSLELEIFFHPIRWTGVHCLYSCGFAVPG